MVLPKEAIHIHMKQILFIFGHNIIEFSLFVKYENDIEHLLTTHICTIITCNMHNHSWM
jgi:hypothetical protein